jgi:hypothetical protein
MHIKKVTFSVLGHALAGFMSAVFLIVIAIAVYFICAAIGNDAGGPMVPLLIPLFIIIGSVATVLVVYFPLSILVGWLARKFQILYWVSPLAFLGLSFLFFTGWLVIANKHSLSFSDVGLATLCGLFFTGGFTIYWLVLVVGLRLSRRHETVA